MMSRRFITVSGFFPGSLKLLPCIETAQYRPWSPSPGKRSLDVRCSFYPDRTRQRQRFDTGFSR